jgi:type IV pilus assembly protein PilC
MVKHPHVFSNFWVNIVETGEASGHLAQSLNQLARYLESVRELQGKTLTALTYPIFLLLAATGAVTFFAYWIIPRFSAIFASSQAQLPWLTTVVIGFSHFVRGFWGLLLAAAAGLVYGVRAFVRTDEGRWLVDRLVLKIPLFNRLFLQLQLAQFARGLSTLLESGVPILYGLEIMERSATNKVYGQAIGEVKELVREGKTMAAPMERSGLFPPMMVQMVQVGEEIGELAKMLGRVAAYYEERVGVFVARLTTLFEPIAIVVMAVIVGVLVISMFLPIFSMTGSYRAG